jgi:hypothetical protein
MADLQTINIGNLVNDGLGDDLRTAFQKVNANFADLNDELTVTVLNTGSTGVGLFKEKVGSELRFKKIAAGTKLSIDEGTDTVVINNTVPDAFIRIDTDAGSQLASNHNTITMQGTAASLSETEIKDIEVTTLGNGVINFKTVIPVTEYLTTFDFGSINGTYANAIQLAMQASNIDFGTITIDSDLSVDLGGLT